MMRAVALLAGLLAALPAVAEELNYDQARHFVAGKLFNYTCFEGTRGHGRVFADGSVVGSIQIRGSGPMRYAHLPAGTLKSNNGLVCASLRGMPIEPCFNVTKLDNNSFRGAVSGLGFAYCDFTRASRPHMLRTRRAEPLALRPSIAANSN